MPGLITTCGKCGAQYSWNSDFQEYPDCPKCGYNAMKINRAKLKECSDAAQLGDLAALKRLLRDPHVKGNINAGPFTILHYAVFGDQLVVAEYILLQGANPNACYPAADNETPLHSAACRQRSEIARLLVSFGADTNQRNASGKTAVDLARESNDQPMAEMLVEEAKRLEEENPRHRAEQEKQRQAVILRVFYPGAFFLVDCKIDVRLDGKLIGEGTAIKGVDVSTETTPGSHNLQLLQLLGRLSKKKDYTFDFQSPGRYEAHLTYSRMWGNFAKDIKLSFSVLEAALRRQGHEKEQEMSELKNVMADLEAYSRKLTEMVSALDQTAERPTVVSLLQDLANADIGRILGLGLPLDWQSQGGQTPERLKSVLQRIQRDAEQAAAFVGREGIPPALDFLLASVRMNVEGRLHTASSVPLSVPRKEVKKGIIRLVLGIVLMLFGTMAALGNITMAEDHGVLIVEILMIIGGGALIYFRQRSRDRKKVLDRPAKLFKPDPRSAEIRRLRSLIKKHYGKGEVMSYLWELNKLGDPVARQIAIAANSNNGAEMERLIRSL